MRETVIVSAVRTPTGKFLGGLKDFTAPQLGALVIKEAVRRAGIAPELVDECLMGNVVSAGLGQAPARQAALVENELRQHAERDAERLRRAVRAHAREELRRSLCIAEHRKDERLGDEPRVPTLGTQSLRPLDEHAKSRHFRPAL